MYLTYKEYRSYGGSADEPTFNRLAFKCGKMIDRLTADRVSKMKEVPEAVKRCITELIQQEFVYEKNLSSLSSAGSTGRVVASFSTDGYQETTGGASGASASGYLNDLRTNTDDLQMKTIRDYLAYVYDDNGTKLLYRGVF